MIGIDFTRDNDFIVLETNESYAISDYLVVFLNENWEIIPYQGLESKFIADITREIEVIRKYVIPRIHEYCVLDVEVLVNYGNMVGVNIDIEIMKEISNTIKNLCREDAIIVARLLILNYDKFERLSSFLYVSDSWIKIGWDAEPLRITLPKEV